MREAIVNELVKEVKALMGNGYEVSASYIRKNNNYNMPAVAIKTPGKHVSPLIYVDEMCELVESGKLTVKEAGRKVIDSYQESMREDFERDAGYIIKKEYILNNVEYQMINAEKNMEKLLDIPHKSVLDLAAIYRTIIPDKNASFVVSNAMMEVAGISLEELDEAAARNTERTGFSICSIGQKMMDLGAPAELCEAPTLCPQLYVITNTRNFNGANALMCDSKMREVAEMLGGDYFIIPSSVHELLAIPAAGIDVFDIKAIVGDINDNVVGPEEVLGYSVYRYVYESGTIEVAA